MRLRRSALFIFTAGSLAALAGPALADARQDVMYASQRCAAIPDDRTWLDCYYGAAQAMRGHLGLPPAPANQQRLVPMGTGAMPPPPAYSAPAYNNAPGYRPPNNAMAAAAPPGPPPIPRRDDGWLGGVFGDSKPVSANQRISSWTRDKTGRFTLVLANGERWQQSPSDVNKAPWLETATRHTVNVRSGALNSYNLTVSGDGTLYKVRRVN